MMKEGQRSFLKRHDVVFMVLSCLISLIAYRDRTTVAIVGLLPLIWGSMRHPSLGILAFFVPSAIEGGIVAHRAEIPIPWGWLGLAVAMQVAPWWVWERRGRLPWALGLLWLIWVMPFFSDFAWPSPVAWGGALSWGSMGLMVAVLLGVLVMLPLRGVWRWSAVALLGATILVAQVRVMGFPQPVIGLIERESPMLVLAYPLEYRWREHWRGVVPHLVNIDAHVVLPENFWVVEADERHQALDRFALWRDRPHRVWMGVMVKNGKRSHQEVWMTGMGELQVFKPPVTFPMFRDRSDTNERSPRDTIKTIMGGAWVLVCYEASVPWRYIGARDAKYIVWMASTWMLPEWTNARQRTLASILSWGVAGQPIVLANWH